MLGLDFNLSYFLNSGPLTLYMVISAAALYGVFFVLFAVSCWMLIVRRRNFKANHFLQAALLAVLVFTTVDICLGLYIVTSVILSSNDPSSVSIISFMDGGGAQWPFVLQTTMTELNILTADAILLYRTWMAWDKRWVVISFNIVAFLGTIATFIRVLQLLVLSMDNPLDISVYEEESNWFLPLLVLSLVQTVTATILISYRLWLVDRRIAAHKSSSFRPIIRIMVESGGLYALTLVTYVIICSVPSLGAVVLGFMEIFSPILGIAFTLIIVRVEMRRKHSGSEESTVATKPTVQRSVRTDQSGSERVLTLTVVGDEMSDMEMTKFNEGARSASILEA